MKLVSVQNLTWSLEFVILNLKKDGWWQLDTYCGFSKKVFFRESAKPSIYVNYVIIRYNIYVENSLKMLRSFNRYDDFLLEY